MCARDVRWAREFSDMEKGGTTYELAALLEHVGDCLLARDVLPDLSQARHKVQQLLHGGDHLAVVTEWFLSSQFKVSARPITSQ